ncbi:hypothetical protein E2562_008185 [Oryza meyeriana var. granulata]|uniref:Uncharacterized protein n=1 Tax=Oryza meyeriana var. granulata TaxID=110450 RepID=A0A6G1CEJ7_9ORYZ|nr:hypothetical protein E2562_008185 [Oryza meyeriana var. granulata]
MAAGVPAALPRLCALVLPFLAVAGSLDVPSHGNRMPRKPGTGILRRPARQEACNEQSCVGVDMTEPTDSKKSGMSGWLVALVLLLGLGAIGGIVFTSYTYYLRRTSGRSGFVYVMMEAYS